MPVLPPAEKDLIDLGVKQVVTCDTCGREMDWLRAEWEEAYFLGRIYNDVIMCWQCKEKHR